MSKQPFCPAKRLRGTQLSTEISSSMNAQQKITLLEEKIRSLRIALMNRGGREVYRDEDVKVTGDTKADYASLLYSRNGWKKKSSDSSYDTGFGIREDGSFQFWEEGVYQFITKLLPQNPVDVASYKHTALLLYADGSIVLFDFRNNQRIASPSLLFSSVSRHHDQLYAVSQPDSSASRTIFCFSPDLREKRIISDVVEIIQRKGSETVADIYDCLLFVDRDRTVHSPFTPRYIRVKRSIEISLGINACFIRKRGGSVSLFSPSAIDSARVFPCCPMPFTLTAAQWAAFSLSHPLYPLSLVPNQIRNTNKFKEMRKVVRAKELLRKLVSVPF